MEEIQLLFKNAENPALALALLFVGKLLRDVARDFGKQLIEEFKALNIKMAVIVERVEEHEKRFEENEKRLDRLENKVPPG